MARTRASISALGQVGVRVEHGGDELVLAVGVEVDQRARSGRLGVAGGPSGNSRAASSSMCMRVLARYVIQRHAPVGEVDPLEERG